MQKWQLAGAFDAGEIRGGSPDWKQELRFHQLEITGHGAQLEADYRLFREVFGLRQYRDGTWLSRSFPRFGEFDWSYLDRLAAISDGQVTLSLCHYEWPVWAEAEDIFNGRVLEGMTEFARQVALRYRGCFAAYIPVVESGYWTAMMTDWGRWWPSTSEKRAGRWWDLYATVGRMLIQMSRAVKEADPHAAIALSEPWAWHPHVSLKDQARPFFTLSGRSDPLAARETGSDAWGGSDDLLDIVGLNFYNNWGIDHKWPLSRLLLEARRQFPNKTVVMGETGNCHFSECHTVADWLRLLDEQITTANAQGADVKAVTWAPILTLGDFDWGHPAPGAWVTWDVSDPTRRRHYTPEVVTAVSRYAS